MKKRYYHDHEGAYRSIREKGEFGWQTPTREDFEKAKDLELISSIIQKHYSTTKNKTALDLGCGTGPTTQTMAELGFQVTGIDVSETAIELAKKNSPDPGIHFEVADVLTFEGKFDFIYDSHCFHCIVPDEDRSLFLKRMKENLKRDGFAFINTMAWIPGYNSDIPGLRFDENYMLWHPTKDHTREGCAFYEERWWCPQRRILPAEKIMEEIRMAGLKIVSQMSHSQGFHPDLLQILVSL